MSEDVGAYLRRNDITHKSEGPTDFVMSCPACGERERARISKKTWLWKCNANSCGAKGNEITLKKAHGVMYQVSSPSGESAEQAQAEAYALAMKARSAKATDVEKWHHDLMHHETAAGARAYLMGRGLHVESWKAGLLGYHPARTSAHPGYLTIPSLTVPGDATTCAMVKLRNLTPDCPKKKRYARKPGGESVLFMPRTIDPKKPVMLVGGELDALSVLQAGFDNVVSSTLGETNWDDIFTRQLEACEDVVIVYDNDSAGKTGALKVVEALGQHRCRIGQWPDGVDDANHGLTTLGDAFDVFMIETIILNAKALQVDGIMEPSTLRERLYASLDPVRAAGIPTGLKDLDALIGGGLGFGAVSLWTGDTGSGKTALLSQIAKDVAAAGFGVMACPFEMHAVPQLDNWVRQMSGKDPAEMPRHELDGYLTKIEALPLWLFDLNRRVDCEAMRNTMVYAAKRLGVQLFVIDHINSMVTPGRTEREQLENMSQMFFRVAGITDAHIAVIAHPKSLGSNANDKHRDNQIIQLSDIKGASALKQDCALAVSVKRYRAADRSDVIDKDGFGSSLGFVLKCRSRRGREGAVSWRYDVNRGCMLDDVPKKPKAGKTTTTSTNDVKQGDWWDD